MRLEVGQRKKEMLSAMVLAANLEGSQQPLCSCDLSPDGPAEAAAWLGC